MGSTGFTAICVGAVAMLPGCGGTPDYPPTPEGVYMARCARCHEIDGSSTTASKQAEREVDFRSAAFQDAYGDQKIMEIAQYGVGRMQGVPGLSASELDSVVVHIRRLGARP